MDEILTRNENLEDDTAQLPFIKDDEGLISNYLIIKLSNKSILSILLSLTPIHYSPYTSLLLSFSGFGYYGQRQISCEVVR